MKLEFCLLSFFFCLCTCFEDNLCFQENFTWSHDTQIGIFVNIASAVDCQDECKKDAACECFTWNKQQHPHLPKLCSIFSSSNSEIPCSNCLSGPQSCICSEAYGCDIVGENIIEIIPDVTQEEDCQAICKDTSDCTVYTWYNDEDPIWSWSCFLFSSCDSTDETCSGCFSGPPDCSASTTTTKPDTTFIPTTFPPAECTGDPIEAVPDYGYWFCMEGSESTNCYLECDPGYAAAGRSLTSCRGGFWSIPPRSFKCEPAVALFHEGSTAEVIGTDFQLSDIPRASSVGEDINFDRAWMRMVYADSKIIMCGGGWDMNSRLTCIEMVSVLNNTWVPHSNMTVKRQDHGLSYLEGEIVAIGGHTSLKTMEFADPWTSDWTQNEASLPQSFDNSCAVKVSPELLIYTGFSFNGYRSYAVAYNKTSNTFRELPNMNQARGFHCCAFIKTDNMTGILVAGGEHGEYNDNEGIKSTEFFNLKTEKWVEVGNLNRRRRDAVMAQVEDKLMIMGGSYYDTWNGDHIYLKDIEEFNFETMTWTLTGRNLSKGTTGADAISIPKSLIL